MKDLARRSNDYDENDFRCALKVLDRIYARRTHGIVVIRGGAGSELIPSSTRQPGGADPILVGQGNDDTGSKTMVNELR